MTFFWSSWITILSIMCWAGILGVLLMVLKYKPEVEEDGTTGHTYDGIQEYDKPLPKWWLVIFFGSIIWAVAYWIFFPAIFPSKWEGITTVEVDGETVPWTSHNELASELESNNKVFTDNFEQNILAKADASGATKTLATLSEMQATMRRSETPPANLQTEIDEKIAELAPYVEKLAENPNALKVGSRLFLQNCAVCHGSNAKGALGYPNLTDNDWLYGGEASHILTTLHNGRVGGMAAWRDQLGEDAKGMISTGAPNLTDNIWLYGGDRESIRDTIRYGRAGVMPEWETKLGNERIMLLAAYVYSLSDRTPQPAKAQPVSAAAPKAAKPETAVAN